MPGRFWTPNEDRLLAEQYYRQPLAATAASLDRTPGACRRRVQVIGVGRRRRAATALRHHEPWTPPEEELLRAHWGGWSVARVARELGRTEGAVRGRADLLGLSVYGALLTRHRLGAIFGVDWRVVDRWVRRGWLRCRRSDVRIGRHRCWEFDMANVDQFMREHPTAYEAWRLPAGPWRSLAEEIQEARIWLTTKEFAARVGIGPQGVRDAIEAGRLPSARKGWGGHWFVAADEARRFALTRRA